MTKIRNKTTKFALRDRLAGMAAFGESKYEDRKETLRLRNAKRKELVLAGASPEEIRNALDEINIGWTKIYSYSTMRSYIQAVDKFAAFIRDMTGNNRMPVEETVKYIQPFVDHLIAAGYSPYTINLWLSGVCKATGSIISNYYHPRRSYIDVFRGVKAVKRDNFNSKRAKEAIELNKVVGLRRNELRKLRISDISYNGKDMLIRSIGKGGKHNVTLISDPESISVVKKYIELAKADGRETLLSEEMMNHDADLHSIRAVCAKREYERVVMDMQENPERREYYINFIKSEFKKVGRRLEENLNNPYRLRGRGRHIVASRGRPVEYDRVAVMYVSLTILHHYRSNVTVDHYLIK